MFENETIFLVKILWSTHFESKQTLRFDGKFQLLTIFREKSLVTLSNQSRHCNLKEKLSYETFCVIFKHCTFIPHQRKETDEVSSSGYSSSFNAEYYPVQTDTMDTEDYELYDPRIHAARPGPTRIVQPRVANKVKPREVLTYSLLTLHKSLHENH